MCRPEIPIRIFDHVHRTPGRISSKQFKKVATMKTWVIRLLLLSMALGPNWLQARRYGL
jgi:hypothetical protein